MADEKPVKLIINVETGAADYVELTAEEIRGRDLLREEAHQRELARQQVEADTIAALEEARTKAADPEGAKSLEELAAIVAGLQAQVDYLMSKVQE